MEKAMIGILTCSREIHRFPLEPARYRKLESEWAASSPFAVVWSWKDALQVFHTGLSRETTRILAAPPLVLHSSAAGAEGAALPAGSAVTGLALHPARDQYAVAVAGAVALAGEQAAAAGGVQVVGDWEQREKTNAVTSFCTPLHAAARCVDYCVDGSLLAVGLASGEVARFPALSPTSSPLLPRECLTPSGRATRAAPRSCVLRSCVCTCARRCRRA